MDENEKNSTSFLMDALKNAGKEELDQLSPRLTAGDAAFPEYMDSILREKGLKRQDVFQRADLPQKYGYKLLSGESHTTDRDKLLRLFFAMGMTLRETQRALALYGLPALYPKKRRDAIFIIALNKGVSSVDTVNEWLAEYGEMELSRSAD